MLDTDTASSAVQVRADRGARSGVLLPLLAITLMSALLTVLTIVRDGTSVYWMVDFIVYRAGGGAVIHGAPLYDMVVHTEAFPNMLFTYPPFAALVFVPLALVGPTAAETVWVFGNFLAIGAVIWLALRTIGTFTRAQLTVLTVAGIAVANQFDAVFCNTLNGQINLLVMLLIILDFSPVVPARWRGLALGIAAGMKLTPLIFIVYLFLTGRRRQALQALATFAATIAVGFAVMPSDSLSYWITDRHFLDSRRITSVSSVVVNHSLPGFIARIGDTVVAPLWWIPIGLAVAVLGVLGAVWAFRRGHDAIGVLVVGLTALVVSPVSWPHHFVWILPALIWLTYLGWRSRNTVLLIIMAAVAAFGLAPFYGLAQRVDTDGQPFQWTPLGTLDATLGGYFVLTVLALLLLPIWLPRLPRLPSQQPPEAGPHHRWGA